MTKFQAQSIQDLMTPVANAARVVRKQWYAENTKCPMLAVVCIEASDGSWCELDAESEEHAKALAKNMVDHMRARGASCWKFNESGKLERRSFYNYYAQLSLED